MPVNNSPQAVSADLVSVREAAQAVGVTPPAVHAWIRRGQLTAQLSPGVRLVSLAAAQALVTPPDPATPADAVALYEAIRLTGAFRHRIVSWVKQGLLVSWPGTHGRLVRLADVLALAQPPAPGGGPPMPADAYLIREAARHAGVSRNQVYSWITRGLLPVWSGSGTGRRVRLADVVALASRYSVSPTPGVRVSHDE